MAQIIIIEDDSQLAQELKEWLEFEKHDAAVINDGLKGLQTISAKSYDFVILDINLPTMSGLEVCHRYREGGGKCPIIMLTGMDSTPDKVAGLDCGADDYLTKPFHPRELSARLKALSRRSPELLSRFLKAGSITMDLQNSTVIKDGKPLDLARMEYALLEFFMRHQDRIFSPDELLNAVWATDSERSPETIRSCIKKLRDKIDSQGQPTIIKNIHGVGYKLVP